MLWCEKNALWVMRNLRKGDALMESTNFELNWKRDDEGHIIGIASNKGWEITPADGENGDTIFMVEGTTALANGVLPTIWLHGKIEMNGNVCPVNISFANNTFQPAGVSIKSLIEAVFKNGGSISTYVYDIENDFSFQLDGKLKLIPGVINFTATAPSGKSYDFPVKLTTGIDKSMDTFIKELQYLPTRIG